MERRLRHLLRLLARLLDNFLLPEDLPLVGPGDEWVYALDHKDIKQLSRLALAQAEAEGVPDSSAGAGAGKDVSAKKAPPPAKPDPKAAAKKGAVAAPPPSMYGPLPAQLPACLPACLCGQRRSAATSERIPT